jgi:hypothetical protein
MVMRVAILAVLALVWWSSSAAHPSALTAAWDWLRARPFLSDRSLAITSGIALLAMLGVLLLLARLGAQRRSDRVAMGIALLLAACVPATLGALLVVGWLAESGTIIRIVATLTLLITIQLAAGLIVESSRARRRRRANRERPLAGEELTRRLAGTTHGIRRVSHDQPPRQWLELRYYAPDGRMPSYAEGNGQTRAYPGRVTWTVKEDLLEISSSLEPTGPRRYRVALGPDGQFSYYHVEPESPIDGMIEFRTVEIRSSEPSAPAEATLPPADGTLSRSG